jgi:hypothetical protein
VLALLAVAPAGAQEVIPPPAAPRPVVPPAFPAASGGVVPTLVSGSGSQPAATPVAPPPSVVEHLPQAGASASGPVLEHAPAAGEHEDDGLSFHGLYFTGDYLLLRPRRDAFDYAVNSPNLTQTPGGTVESANFNTESGFRFGAGVRVPGQDVYFGLTWTNLSSRGDSFQGAPAGGALFATLTRAGSFDQVETATASTNLDYNVLDVELSRRVKYGDCFNVNLSGGGRFAWINQQFTAVYNGGPDHAVNDTVQSPVYFNGAGLTAGAEGQWNFYHGLGLYARARGSLLSGQFKNYLTETTANNSIVIVNVNEKNDQIVPVAELGMGLNYCSEHWHVSIGYEMTNWFNMVNSLDFPDSSNIGKVGRRTSDLSLEGLAVQLGLAF